MVKAKTKSSTTRRVLLKRVARLFRNDGKRNPANVIERRRLALRVISGSATQKCIQRYLWKELDHQDEARRRELCAAVTGGPTHRPPGCTSARIIAGPTPERRANRNVRAVTQTPALQPLTRLMNLETSGVVEASVFNDRRLRLR